MPENPYQSPQPSDQAPELIQPTIVSEGDGISVLIPYKNKASLIAYYSGVFSICACIPLAGVLGVVLAIIAVVFGFKGLRYANEHPEARGRVHCWIGIITGMIFAILGGLTQMTIIVSIFANLSKQ